MKKRKANPSSGFSLVEILVVLLIITMIAGLVAVNVVKQPGKARVKTAKIQIDSLKSALQIYYTEQGRYPTENQGLEALVRRPTVEPVPEDYPGEGYLDSTEVPKDPWGNDFIYIVPGGQGQAFEIISYGADGEPGGPDEDADISSANL